MPSTVEINNNSERLALRRTIESVLASKTARRVAQTAAWHVFKDASLANLQYLQSHIRMNKHLLSIFWKNITPICYNPRAWKNPYVKKMRNTLPG